MQCEGNRQFSISGSIYNSHYFLRFSGFPTSCNVLFLIFRNCTPAARYGRSNENSKSIEISRRFLDSARTNYWTDPWYMKRGTPKAVLKGISLFSKSCIPTVKLFIFVGNFLLRNVKKNKQKNYRNLKSDHSKIADY